MDGLHLDAQPPARKSGSAHPCSCGSLSSGTCIGEALPDSIADRPMGVEIFRLLRNEHDALSVQDIQVKTGISYSRVLNELRWMREADAIQRKRRPVGAGYLYFIGKSAIPTLSTWTDDAKQYAQSLLEDGYEPREAAEMISQRIGQRVTSKMVSELKAEPVEEKISRKCSRCRTDFQAKSRFYFLCDNCRRLATESGLV